MPLNVVEKSLGTYGPNPKDGLESACLQHFSCVTSAKLLNLSVLRSPTGVSYSNITNTTTTKT